MGSQRRQLHRQSKPTFSLAESGFLANKNPLTHLPPSPPVPTGYEQVHQYHPAATL